MTVKFDKAVIRTEQNETFLSLRLPVESWQEARRFAYDMKPGKVYAADLKLYREKRSLDANSYFWRLLDELSKSLGETKEALYLRYVKECGPFRDFLLSEEEAKTFQTAWSMLGVGWPTERIDYAKDGDRVMIRAYYGSSTYNTKQMGRLIDSVVQDCKAVGIETLPPDKLAAMKEGWERA